MPKDPAGSRPPKMLTGFLNNPSRGVNNLQRPFLMPDMASKMLVMME